MPENGKARKAGFFLSILDIPVRLRTCLPFEFPPPAATQESFLDDDGDKTDDEEEKYYRDDFCQSHIYSLFLPASTAPKRGDALKGGTATLLPHVPRVHSACA